MEIGISEVCVRFFPCICAEAHTAWIAMEMIINTVIASVIILRHLPAETLEVHRRSRHQSPQRAAIVTVAITIPFNMGLFPQQRTISQPAHSTKASDWMM